MSRGMQTNAAILPTVGRLTKDIITLEGYPPPASSHLTRPSPPHRTAGSLKEMTGQIGEAHDVLHHLSNLLVPLAPWGTEVNVQIAEEERNMPTRAFVSGLLDCRHCAQVVRWDVASHSKKLAASCHQHEGQYVRPPNPPVLDQVRFVGSPKEGNPTLVRAGGVRRNIHSIFGCKFRLSPWFPLGSQGQRLCRPSPVKWTPILHSDRCGCCTLQPQLTCYHLLVMTCMEPSPPWDFRRSTYVKRKKS